VPDRWERILLVLFTACWAVALAHFAGAISLAGPLPLSLYGLYSTAVASGWLFGNVYARRRKRLPPPLKRRVLLLYCLGPPGILYLLRALVPAADQLVAPLVPLYALGVYTVLFLVPVTLTWAPGGGERDHGRSRER
jgi:hypothetical protein